jgi:hypothetical protein
MARRPNKELEEELHRLSKELKQNEERMLRAAGEVRKMMRDLDKTAKRKRGHS